MEKKNKDCITAFDSLFTTNQIQMFKILLTYMEPALQKNFCIYIKFMELQYTITFFQRHPYSSLGELSDHKGKNTCDFFDEILPLCDISQREKIKQMKNMMKNLENMQEMMSTLEMLKELFPEGMETETSSDATESAGMGNMGMGGMDIMQLFNMFNSGNMPDISSMADVMNLFQNK